MKVGELNGKWSILFRATLATSAVVLPFLVSLNVWLVVSAFEQKARLDLIDYRLGQFIGAGPRYTATDAQVDLARFREELLKEIKRDFPPKWLVDRVDAIALEARQAHMEVEALERDFTKNFVRKDELLNGVSNP